MNARFVSLLLLLAFLLSLLGSSCARQAYVPEKAPPSGRKETVREPGQEVGEEELEAIPEPVSSQREEELGVEAPSSYVEQEEPAGVEESDIVSGYRVQIFASSSLERAEEVANEARALFAEEVYVEYSVPLYRVRVGDFASKEEAIEFRERAIEAGYEGAWVAEALIQPE